MRAPVYTAAMSNVSSGDERVADALPGHWADRVLPVHARPYARLARLERPIGWWLLLLPCWWGLALGQMADGGGIPDLWHGMLFLIGAIVMRAAGCAANDIADRDFDARVARTRARPIASGQVSVTQALVFLAGLCAMGLTVLLQFNWHTVFLASASLVIAAVYPFAKRITYWPQLVLGLAFNWGALVGWSATHGSLSLPPVLLYLGGVFWTLAYDTIYAHQDKEDDALIGIKSTALKLGKSTPRWLGLFFALSLTLIAAATWLAGGGIVALTGIAGAALHAAWQLSRFDDEDQQGLLELFRSNRVFGLIIAAALLVDCLIR